MRVVACALLLCALYYSAPAQVSPYKFGDGIRIYGKDSSFYMRSAFRFQTLFNNTWTDVNGKLDNYQAGMLIRRSRLKFDGFVLDPRLTFKFELSLSNRDISGGDGAEFSRTANVVLDAIMTYNFYKNLSIQFGQTKLPGNRERVISSANLQFVDRSRLNARYNIDRDVGFQLLHHHTLGKQFLIQEILAFSQGEGRNVTAGHFGGFDYTFRLELLPFGKFKSRGDYIGASIVREPKPKLSLGFTYDVNNNAVRERGQLGRFIIDNNGVYHGRTLQTFFADAMFKFKGLSVMSEYAHKQTYNRNSTVYDSDGNLIGTFFTGDGFVIQAGYMFPGNWEIAGRYTTITPDAGVSNNEQEYTLGLSRFIVGHKLKVQTDVSYRDITGRNNLFFWRFQTELHF